MTQVKISMVYQFRSSGTYRLDVGSTG